MSDKVQISEKQARDMLDKVHTTVCRPSINYDETITRWRQEGYIKQSKLEEAREWVAHNLEHLSPNRFWIRTCAEMYEVAIAELLEDKS